MLWKIFHPTLELYHYHYRIKMFRLWQAGVRRGSKAESPTAGLNAAKRGNATQKNIDMYKEKKLAGDVDAELDRSGPILSTGQIGAIMHPNDREEERERKEKEKEKKQEKKSRKRRRRLGQV